MRRRELLGRAIGSAAGVLIGGCSRRATDVGSTPPTVTTLQGTGGLFTSGVVSAFNRTHPKLQLEATRTAGPDGLAGYVFESSVGSVAARYVPLDAALRTTAFPMSSIPAAAWNAFMVGGHTVAVPYEQNVWGVLWRKDAFAAAGVPPPTADWTVSDFEGACADLAALIQRGTPSVTDLDAPLGPVILGPQAAGAPGAVVNPGLWQSFALGYGATPVTNGAIDLTSAAAEEGLSTLLDLARRYGSAQSSVVPAGKPAPIPTFALYFGQMLTANLPTPFLLDGFQFGSEWNWARMPRFPSAPVVETSLVGYGLSHIATPKSAQLAAGLAVLMNWALNGPGRTYVDAAGSIPAVQTGAVQEAFWSHWPQQAAVADWQHFANFAAGWPSAALAWQANGAVATVLSKTLSDPGALESGLSQAQQTLSQAIQQA